jgi:hypothetical protein
LLADHFRSWEHVVCAPMGGARLPVARRDRPAARAHRREPEGFLARYRSRGTPRASERKFDPYRVRVAEEDIYVLAHCHRDNEIASTPWTLAAT